MLNFLKKTKEKSVVVDASKPAVNPVQGDFLVHNMPVAKSLSAATTNHVAYSNLNDNSGSKTTGVNHQSVGLLIISGGVILVAGVIYGAYYFIIRPYTQTTTPPAAPISNQTANSSANVSTVTSSSNQVISSSSLSSSSTPLSSSTASSSAATTSPLTSPTDLASSTISLSSSTASTTVQIASSTVVAEVDTDNDGLSDVEEALLGTNPASADTNGNGFSDLTELRNGYDPTKSGVKLSSSSPVMFYNFNNVATLVYPSGWQATENETKDAVVFSNGEKSFIQLSAQNNNQKALDISTWFQTEFNGLTPGGSVSGPGWQGVYSPDQLTVYLMGTKTDKVYILAYSPLTDNSASLTMFHIMIKTLTIK
jgi:hypothetical protein